MRNTDNLFPQCSINFNSHKKCTKFGLFLSTQRLLFYRWALGTKFKFKIQCFSSTFTEHPLNSRYSIRCCDIYKDKNRSMWLSDITVFSFQNIGAESNDQASCTMFNAVTSTFTRGSDSGVHCMTSYWRTALVHPQSSPEIENSHQCFKQRRSHLNWRE